MEAKQEMKREATRVTIDEVKERMERGEKFTFLDTRNAEAWAEGQTKVSGAIRVPADEVEQHLSEIPHDRTVITYCTCPHEASSARVAQTLSEQGYKNVHPLFIGFEAWEKAGLPLESK
ncbi:MAG: rhodanese-like domain-containing protein [Pyrinomonadaceae bacterium]